jgi:hypothetical protein
MVFWYVMPLAVSGFLNDLSMGRLEQIPVFLPIRDYSSSFRLIFSRITKIYFFLSFFTSQTFSYVMNVMRMVKRMQYNANASALIVVP